METIRFKRGYTLQLNGEIRHPKALDQLPVIGSQHYGIKPDDFTGIIPRLNVKEGDSVAAGDVLFHDKNHEEINVTSPVAGTVKAIVRGERRKIETIVIESDGSNRQCAFNLGGDAKAILLQSGLWAMMRQRPYDVVPSPNATPRDIFVTCFDSAPLAPDLHFALGEKVQYLQKGVAVLKTLTSGNVYLGVPANDEKNAPFLKIGGEVIAFDAPHPAGNAGVQAANIKPVNKGETIWTLDVITLARIGQLFTTGLMNYDTIVAITGSEVNEPQYVKTTMGCAISALVEQQLQHPDTPKRIISGNVLTGQKVLPEDFLRAPYRHITVIPELSHPDEFMGWASLSTKKFSVYHNFTHWICRRRNFSPDARLNGSERAIVMTGEYDSMLPMDIHAEFLIKAIIAFDIDKMEQLGIYEVAPEDFALAEYADTSKLPLQHIVRNGLDRMRKEME